MKSIEIWNKGGFYIQILETLKHILVPLRVFFMFLLTFYVTDNLSAQTVIYPDGKTCAEPGDEVEVLFDRNIRNMEFNTQKLSNCNNSTYICDWVFIIFPRFCPPSDCPLGNVMNPNIEDDNRISLRIPADYSDKDFVLYYGTRTSTSFRFIIEWQTKRYEYIGAVKINVCTDDPVVRVPNCYCPDSEIMFEVENFYDVPSDDFSLSYENGNETIRDIEIQSPNFDPNTGRGTFFWNVPANVQNDFNLTIKNGSKKAQEKVSMCMPEIRYVPDCSVKDQEISYSIVNACPSLTYKIDEQTLHGASSYNVTSKYNPSNNSQTFTLKLQDEAISSFVIPQCEIKVTLNEKIPSVV